MWHIEVTIDCYYQETTLVWFNAFTSRLSDTYDKTSSLFCIKYIITCCEREGGRACSSNITSSLSSSP